jgi:uncharacterized protein
MTRLHIYKDKRGEWRWTLFAGNGKKLANSGEGYTRKRRCVEMTKRLFPWFGSR